MSILNQIEGAARSIVAAAMVSTGLIIAVIFAPIWATLIAKLCYKPGFEESVAKALAEIPDFEKACIYDDARNIYVTSLDQLNVDRMIEKAVQDRIPKFSFDGRQRDPHFRVYVNGDTYWWSFRERNLNLFREDSWTLADHSERSCRAYKRDPRLFRDAFRQIYSIEATEDNFCCGTTLSL